MRSAISAAASSSRLARSRSRPCAACIRQLHSSSPLSVFRPQEPYECPRPTIDAYGHPALPFHRPFPKINEDDELDPEWNKLCEETDNKEGVWTELQRMAEPNAQGFYERYGAHDGYGLRNRERWRKDAEGKMEPWGAAGAGWKEVLGFKRGAVRPGARVEVEGFKHRDSVRIENYDDRRERERLRVEYIQPEGASWGVRGERQRIAAPSGDAHGEIAGGEGEDRWKELNKRGKELENIAMSVERARLLNLDPEGEDAEPDGPDGAFDDDGSMPAPTRKQIRADWMANQRTKAGDEWTGESDFDPKSDRPAKPGARQAKKRAGDERSLPPHLQAGAGGAREDNWRGQARTGAAGTRDYSGDYSSKSLQREPGEFVPRNERQQRTKSTVGSDTGRPGRAGARPGADMSRGPKPSGFGMRRSYSTAPRRPGAPGSTSTPQRGQAGASFTARPQTFAPRHTAPAQAQRKPFGMAPSASPRAATAPRAAPASARPSPRFSEDDAANDETSTGYVRPPPKTPAEHWKPTKKLTYSAMAGLRELHATDPERYTRQYLSVKFGISFEAVCRILKSSWREKGAKRKSDPGFVASGSVVPEEKSLTGTKWDVRPETSLEYSPVHAIRQAASGRGEGE